MAAALGQDVDDDSWIDNLADLSHDPGTDPEEAPEPEPRLPPWPVRRVTAGMKRCPLPDADRLVVLFSDLLSKDPDPWADTDLDPLRAPSTARWMARRRCSWSSLATV